MPPSQVNFEHLRFNPFYYESFSDIEDERDPAEKNVFIFFEMRLKLFLSEKENSETINAII